MTGFRPRAVIFDLDGLVLDTESGFIAAWRQTASELGYRLDADFWPALCGLSAAAAMNRIAGACGTGFDAARFAQLATANWRLSVRRDGIAVKPGLFRLLQALAARELPYCLATNSPRAAAEECLALAGIAGYFPLRVCGDEVPDPKPAPDLFLHAGRLLATAMPACLVLEDSAPGVAAAAAAGAPCVYLPGSAPADAGAARSAIAICADLAGVVALL